MPGSARAGERDDADVGPEEELHGLRELAISRPRSGVGGVGSASRTSGLEVERRVLVQDLRLEPAKLGSRLEAELVEDVPARRYASSASAWRPLR